MTLLSALSRPPGLGLLAALLAAAPAAASDPFGTFAVVWARPAAPHGTPVPCARLLTLETPRDWVSGDAAAVLVTIAPAPERQVQAVTAALLAQETAVMHMPVGSGGIGDCAALSPEPVTEILGALVAVQGQAGAGLVVAVGLGAAGSAVLDAVREETARAVLGSGGARLAAGIALDEAWAARFRAGAPPPPQEGWARRSPLLCEALAPLVGPSAAADCLTALAAPQRGLASLRGPRR